LLQLQAASLDTTESGTQQQRFEHVAMALEALRNVIKASPGNQRFLKSTPMYQLIFHICLGGWIRIFLKDCLISFQALKRNV
jgi:hypothetical protein